MSNRVYHDAHNTPASNSQVSIDRARGGQIQITLTIPKKTHKLKLSVGSGVVEIPEVSVTFAIDLEQMPLVNVASYKTDRTQTGPATIPYPNGVITYSESFG